MDEKLKASFIPKQPLVGSESPKGKGGPDRKNLLMIVSFVIFFLSLLSFGGMYLWEYLAKQSVEEKSEELVSMQSKIAEAPTSDYQQLNNRLRVSADKIASHKVTFPIFELLSEITLPTVQFTDFSFSSEIPQPDESEIQINPETGMPIPLPPKPEVYSINMSGIANSFETISLQTRFFKNTSYFRSSAFSNFSLDDETGGISFDVVVQIDPDLIRYPDYVERTEGVGIEQDIPDVDFVDTEDADIDGATELDIDGTENLETENTEETGDIEDVENAESEDALRAAEDPLAEGEEENSLDE